MDEIDFAGLYSVGWPEPPNLVLLTFFLRCATPLKLL